MKVGSRVICIDDSYVEGTVEELKIDCPNWVVKDTIYTIDEIFDLDYVVSVVLKEIRNPMKYFRLTNDVREPAFKISRFRLLQEDEVAVNVEEEVSVF
jgi:hypothetical protein